MFVLVKCYLFFLTKFQSNVLYSHKHCPYSISYPNMSINHEIQAKLMAVYWTGNDYQYACAFIPSLSARIWMRVQWCLWPICFHDILNNPQTPKLVVLKSHFGVDSQVSSSLGLLGLHLLQYHTEPTFHILSINPFCS